MDIISISIDVYTRISQIFAKTITIGDFKERN